MSYIMSLAKQDHVTLDGLLRCPAALQGAVGPQKNRLRLRVSAV